MRDDHRIIYSTFAVAKRKAEKKIPYKPEFFSGFLFATAKVEYITAMIIPHLILHSTVHIYDFHIFNTSIMVICAYGHPKPLGSNGAFHE